MTSTQDKPAESALTPRKRVPLQTTTLLSDADKSPSMSDGVWSGLLREINEEAKTFRMSGKLVTPRKREPDAPPARKEETPAPPAPVPFSMAAAPPANGSASDASVKALLDRNATPAASLPMLKILYQNMLPDEIDKMEAVGLLHKHVRQMDPAFAAPGETDMHRKIQQRQQELDAAAAERTKRAAELRAEQRPVVSEYEQFIKHYNEEKEQERVAALRDQRVLEEIDNSASREEQQKEARNQYAAQTAEERKRIAADRAAARKAERERRIAELKAKEEETEETYLAVGMYRAKWVKVMDEVEKTGNTALLEE